MSSRIQSVASLLLSAALLLGVQTGAVASATTSAEIHGHVYLRAQDGGLAPLASAGFEVVAAPPATRIVGNGRTRADGSYSVSVPAGRYIMRFTGPSLDRFVLPGYLGGTRSIDGAQVVTLSEGDVLHSADAVLEVGGLITMAPRFSPEPGSAPRHLDPLMTTYSFFRRDESSGAFTQVPLIGPATPIGSPPEWGPLESGTYRISIRMNYYTEPFGPSTTRVFFSATVDDVEVLGGVMTDVGPVELTTRYYDASRVAGADRWATSAAISATTYDPDVPVAYLANGTTFPDALSGAPAAGATGGPVLLTAPHDIPAVVLDELRRLAPRKIVLLGGTGAITEHVAAQARSLAPLVSRVAGADRWATSAAISATTYDPDVPVAYLANGTTFPDALSGAPAAGATGGPVLLTTPHDIPAVVLDELRRLAPRKIVLLGGTGAITEHVAAQARSLAPLVSRVAGADRWATSAAISATTYDPDVPVAYLANGTTFPDALSGAPAAGATGGPVLLTTPHDIPAVVLDELRRLAPRKIVLLGGTGAITEQVMTRVRDILQDG